MLHSSELQKVLGEERCRTAHPRTFLDTLKIMISVSFNKEARCVVIWNLGIAFLLAPILRVCGKKIIYTKHEPGTLNSRMQKTGKITLSVIQHMLVEYYSLLFNQLIVFNKKAIRNKREIYLPLIFSSKFLKNDSRTPNRLVYLGGRLETRAYTFLKNLKIENHDIGFEIVFFPAEFEDTSELAKQEVLQQGHTIIWNFFTVQYNQSGVTIDALRYGIPVILSDYDTQIPDNGLRYRADSFLKNETNLISEIENIFDNYDEYQLAIRTHSVKVEGDINSAWRQFFDDNTS